jgi:hypothetical protein
VPNFLTPSIQSTAGHRQAVEQTFWGKQSSNSSITPRHSPLLPKVLSIFSNSDGAVSPTAADRQPQAEAKNAFNASESPITMKIAFPSKRGRLEGFWVLVFGIGFFDC